jgi:hypothetical protein
LKAHQWSFGKAVERRMPANTSEAVQAGRVLDILLVLQLAAK